MQMNKGILQYVVGAANRVQYILPYNPMENLPHQVNNISLLYTGRIVVLNILQRASLWAVLFNVSA